MIDRILRKEIIGSLNRFPAVALLGARQTGKTTLAKTLIHDLKKDIFYLDLEDPGNRGIMSNIDLFFSSNEDKTIIIDEVQRDPELFPVLRSYIDRRREPGRFLLLGSANPHLLRLTSESLAGRIVYLELTGLNVLEVSDQADTPIHWFRGGFPEPFLQEQDEIRRQWFSSFIMTYTERDIPLLGLKIANRIVMQCIYMIAHSTANLLNKSSLASALGIRQNDLSTILDFLESSFLIRRLQPFYVNIGKRLVRSPKIFIRDSGLLHYLLDITSFNDLMKHPVLGHAWESYAIEQLISVFEKQYQYYFYRTQDGAECDLVICKSNKPLSCIEIKHALLPGKTKSLTTTIHDLRTRHNFIIVPHVTENYLLDRNLTVCSIKGFFSEFRRFPG